MRRSVTRARWAQTTAVACAMAGVMGAGAATATPPVVQQAIDAFNDRVRTPMGLPDIVSQGPLEQAAAAHVRYWEISGDASGHEESAGLQGFTGAMPWDRCRAAGAPMCGEIAFPRVSDPVAAIDGWLRAPLHGENLLNARFIGLASGPAGSVADLVGAVKPGADRRAAGNSARAVLRAWPANGSTGVAATWQGAEYPDPLAAYGGDRGDVGPAVYAMSGVARTTVRLKGPGGPVPLLVPGAAQAAATVLLPRRGEFVGLLAGRRLAPGATYVLTVTAPGVTTLVSRFRVG